MPIHKTYYRYARPLIASAYHAGYRSLLPLRWWLADHFCRQPPQGLPLPPAKLRFRVGECTDRLLFYRVGAQTADNLRESLTQAGYSINGFGSILDFGCGCGRTLMWLVEAVPEARWHGTDVDADAIDWCRRHIGNAAFNVNLPIPPVSFPDGGFDLVYAISVFTHLSEELQRAWVPELHRILRPGGILLVTFYSEHVWKVLDAAQEVTAQGFVFRTSAKLRGVLPEWYHTALQTAGHLTKTISPHFSVIKLCPRAFGDQDAIIARRV